MVRCRRPILNPEYVGRRYPLTRFSSFVETTSTRAPHEARPKRSAADSPFGTDGVCPRNTQDPKTRSTTLAEDHLERFPILVVLAIDRLIDAGFEIVPTFRTPHVTIAFDGDLDAGLAVLVALGADARPNPYHEPEPR